MALNVAAFQNLRLGDGVKVKFSYKWRPTSWRAGIVHSYSFQPERVHINLLPQEPV